MGNAETGGSRPPINADGVKRLIAQLDKDLAKVMASGASPALKTEIKDLVDLIKAAVSSDPGNGPKWVQLLAPQFEKLTPKVNQALGTNDWGACAYSNPDGCIQSTQAQCDELGGYFTPSVPCPPHAP